MDTSPCDIPLRSDFPPSAVIGGGNLGLASAAWLAARGASVSLYIRGSERGRRKLASLAERGALPFTPMDAAPREVRLDLASERVEEVLAGRRLVFVTTPADGHPEVARHMAGCLEPGTHLVLHPGQTHGALAFRKALLDAGVEREILRSVSISELFISIFTTRSTVDDVRYSALKHFMAFSSFPARATGEVLSLVEEIFPTTRFRAFDDCLAMAFHPIATGPHTLITLTRLGDLADGRSYVYYLEGVNAQNTKLMRRFDDERCAIARAWGYQPLDLLTCMQRMYDLDYDLERMYTANPAYEGYGSPTSLHTRYFTEEMPCGVKPLLDLAAKAGVETPMIRAVETMLDVLYEDMPYDFDAQARTLESLGLDGLSLEELKRLAQTGEEPRS